MVGSSASSNYSFQLITKFVTLPVYDTCFSVHDEILTRKRVLVSIVFIIIVHEVKCFCTCHVLVILYLFGEVPFVLTCISIFTGNMTCLGHILCALTLLVLYFDYITGIGDVIYAINAGGEAHVDSLGVRYERDPLHGKVGTASDYGKRLLIGRVLPDDHILYQTERYHHSTFGYDIPINEDGDYVMILKFCEVYFSAPNMKVGLLLLYHKQGQ